MTEAFLAHYHDERPHQGRGLGNRPPRVAFLTLPTRPPLPEMVDLMRERTFHHCAMT